MQNPPAEVSGSITGADARLSGILTRGRDAQYQPLLADPAGTVNADLVRIVNRPTAPNNGFKEWKPRRRRLPRTSSGAIATRSVSAPKSVDVPCDVRRAYYANPFVWDAVLSRLRDPYAQNKISRNEEGGYTAVTKAKKDRRGMIYDDLTETGKYS